MIKVGFITIGQSPRVDVLEDFKDLMNKGLEVIEAGALDGLSIDYIRTNLAPAEGETLYVSRLASGEEVVVSREKIIQFMQKKISELESKNVDLIVILCSGEFPEFKSKKPIIYPSKLLSGVVSSVLFNGKLAVLIPRKEQVGYAYSKWSVFTKNLVVKPASPYKFNEQEFRRVIEEIKREDPQLIVMDCVGYSSKHKLIAFEATGKPIVATRGVIKAFLAELIDA